MPTKRTSKKILSGNTDQGLLAAPELRELLLDHFNLSGVIILNAERTVIYASPKALQALELTEESLVGKNFTEAVPFLDNYGAVIPEHKRPSFRALLGTSVQATLFFCQYRLPTIGDLTSLSIRAAGIKRGNKTLGAVVELRRAEKKLNAGGMKSLFTGFAAHQLKTPSSIVKGFLELLLRQGKPAFKDEQWNFLNSAFEANERLIRLSQTLLNITRLEGGMIELQPVKTDIGRVFREKVNNYAHAAKESKIKIAMTIEPNPLEFLTDPGFIAEMVDVLINNALKIAPTKSTVTILAKLENQQLELSVSDQGAGLPEDILSKLRGPLAEHQPGHGSPTGGNGLGLYMARKYAALLHGDITGENLAGGGAKLTIVLPHLK